MQYRAKDFEVYVRADKLKVRFSISIKKFMAIYAFRVNHDRNAVKELFATHSYTTAVNVSRHNAYSY
jgi:hypothetical protein